MNKQLQTKFDNLHTNPNDQSSNSPNGQSAIWYILQTEQQRHWKDKKWTSESRIPLVQFYSISDRLPALNTHNTILERIFCWEIYQSEIILYFTLCGGFFYYTLALSSRYFGFQQHNNHKLSICLFHGGIGPVNKVICLLWCITYSMWISTLQYC